MNKKKLKEEINFLLNENNQIFMFYGPTLKNKLELGSEKPEIWRVMAKDIIIPNNKKIIELLEKNKKLLNDRDKEIFIRFKIHAKGFEENQNREEKIAEYIQFPTEIYNILI